MDYADKAREIISRVTYMTVASVSSEGEPWATPVYFGYDCAYNLYWASWTESRHSRNLARNPNVFVVIYDSAAREGSGQGVYIKANAQALMDAVDIDLALRCAFGRASKIPPGPEEFIGDRRRRMYRARPEQVWINITRSIGGERVDDRVEVRL